MNLEVDNHKLMYHPKRVSEYLEKGDCFPVYIEIGPTNRCNHRCAFCALDFLEHGGYDIDRDVLLKNLKDMAEHGVKSIMFAGEGEPLLHKNIAEFIRYSKNQGVDLSITTNGVLFNREKAEEILQFLSWIRFSVDAANKKTYAKIHGTKERDFDKVIENINYSSQLKKQKNLQTTIGVQCLALSENIEEIEKLAAICKKIGADNLQVKPYSHHPLSKNDFSVSSARLSELENSLKKFEDENFKIFYRKQTIERISQGINYPECYGLPFFALIDSKGDVIPCNLFYNNPGFTYGNLNEKKFSEIWTSNRRKQVIKKIKRKGISECRRGCRLDVINRYLQRIKNPDLHDNFI